LYTIQFLPAAAKELKALPRKEIVKIDKELLALAKNPHQNTSVTALQGFNELYRLRVGDYRVVFKIENRQLLILVIKIGHRKEVYDLLKERIKSLRK
jgi:mRNA interferase RelE/StbE